MQSVVITDGDCLLSLKNVLLLCLFLFQSRFSLSWLVEVDIFL